MAIATRSPEFLARGVIAAKHDGHRCASGKTVDEISI